MPTEASESIASSPRILRNQNVFVQRIQLAVLLELGASVISFCTRRKDFDS